MATRLANRKSKTRHVRFFFFNDTATTEIYTLSLHDALPICSCERLLPISDRLIGNPIEWSPGAQRAQLPDRKSTRLNSSHLVISYAVFCLKKKKKKNKNQKIKKKKKNKKK